MDRISILEEFLKEDPRDPFNSYALALEYLKIDTQKAQTLFEQLLTTHPNYLPTYYPFAQLLIERRDSKVDVIFKQGIDMAKRMNDAKTLRELNSAYTDWLFEQS
jgi:lipoprotein NlpI